jgi:hypothetical protein
VIHTLLLWALVIFGVWTPLALLLAVGAGRAVHIADTRQDHQ